MPTLFINRSFIALALALALLAKANANAPPPPPLPVRGYILLDFHSNEVLAERNADQPLEPASITKIMSAYVLYGKLAAGAIKPSDIVTVSANAYGQEGSRMFVEINSQVSVNDLLMGMVVQSGNDASVALAEHAAGSESVFADLMNQQAAALGMRNSHFVNATGLPHPEHITTARDIATLVRAMISNYPQHYSRYAVKEFTYNNINQKNRNKLLWSDSSVDGVKTGHTSSAGYCLASSAERDGMRLIAVVLGADNEPDRFSAAQQLLDHGFRLFETFHLYRPGQAVTETRVWKGVIDNLRLGFANDVYVTIPRGRYQDMQASLRLDKIIEAPVKRGQPYGQVLIQLDGRTEAQPALIALDDVPEGSAVGRLIDHITLVVKSWLD